MTAQTVILKPFREALRYRIELDGGWINAIGVSGDTVQLMEDLGFDFLTVNDFIYTSEGKMMLLAVLKIESSSQAEIRAITEQATFRLFYYADERDGWHIIDRASRAAIKALQREPVLTSDRGAMIIRWLSRSPTWFERQLDNAAAMYDLFQMRFRRR